MNDEQKQEDRTGAVQCQELGGCYGMVLKIEPSFTRYSTNIKKRTVVGCVYVFVSYSWDIFLSRIGKIG